MMRSVAPLPQARAGFVVRAQLVFAMAMLAGCYTGLDEPEVAPWDTAASASDGAATTIDNAVASKTPRTDARNVAK